MAQVMADEYPVHHRDAYDRAYERTPRVLAIQRARNKARYDMVKRYGEKMMAGKDVDHIHPLAAGGSNRPSNWRLRDPRQNQGDKSVFKRADYRPIHVP
jgi:hypothetical protein